jgi:hypothetical protein
MLSCRTKKKNFESKNNNFQGKKHNKLRFKKSNTKSDQLQVQKYKNKKNVLKCYRCKKARHFKFECTIYKAFVVKKGFKRSNKINETKIMDNGEKVVIK